ncbi:MAG: anthranilate synthase component I family protein [Thermoproteota archaeon]|nr:anthranilate synthase component I family protein [Thermoproteota archaeon]
MNEKLKNILQKEGNPKFEVIDTTFDPFEIFQKLCYFYDDLFIFESLEGPKELVKSSIIGFNPSIKLKCTSNKIFVYKNNTLLDKIKTSDPFITISQSFPYKENNDYRYIGGLVGYISYEAVKLWENIPVKINKQFPLMEFGLYNDGIIYDHEKSRIVYFFYQKSRLPKIINIINSKDKKTEKFNFGNLERNMSEQEYEQKVKRIKKNLMAGDIFQAVLSKKIKFTFKGNPLSIYQTLRKINPSPYMFYFKSNKRILIGASPEMLLRITFDDVETYPIAGSRPVSSDKEITDKLKDEMLKDEKEIAEHTMLVDLARNDLGKICKFGSVFTDQLMTVKQFSHIQHIVSHVTGKINQDYNAFDAFKAMFPAGTVTGAPKVRAMEIINDLEPEGRGPYAGAIGYFSFNKCCDFAKAIRSIFINDNKGYTQSGAGIVIDSMPNKEYQETEDKSNAIISSLKKFNKVT